MNPAFIRKQYTNFQDEIDLQKSIGPVYQSKQRIKAILESVKKTRKIVIVDEDYPRCSIAADVAALVAEQAFDYLDAPPKRLNPPHTSVPYSQPLEALFVPNKDQVVEAALEALE